MYICMRFIVYRARRGVDSIEGQCCEPHEGGLVIRRQCRGDLYQGMVESKFRHLQKTYKFNIVDGNRPPERINRELRKKIQSVVAGR